MEKDLLYFIPAKGLGDFLCRLNAIYSLSPHFRKIYLVGPPFSKDLLKPLPNIQILTLAKFIKDRFFFLKKVDLIIYASRDHSLLGFLKYFYLFASFKNNFFLKLYKPSFFYLIQIFQFFSKEIPKSQNEFYIHQALQVISAEREKSFLYSKEFNHNIVIEKFNNFQQYSLNKKQKFLNNIRLNRNIKKILIFPSGQFAYKIWPFYLELINLLLEVENFDISVLAANKNELELFNKIHSNKFELFYGLSLPKLRSKIDNTDLVISNDSGPKHFASLCKKTCLSIDGYFSSWSTSSYCDNSFSVLSSGYNSRTFFSRRLRYKSLNEISPEFIFEFVLFYLNNM